ncbi:ATP-binding protein [Oribacterium sp. oral taxon 078]|uniref:ATP-binding protein n=1 Tax=Oribacterium sp. oral taxon 078 TaxID=652706 RepID=UPI00040298A1|nr:ATP-binding protein [Oribacterium sp. oral taxon 078]
MTLKLAKMEIDFFRNFHDVQFDIGRKITVISGQNGVGKSNIVSLIASGSGLNKKGELGSNFQPEFYDFFNVESTENFTEYKLFLTYKEDGRDETVLKRLSFKDDTATNRGIRIIPRTSNRDMPGVGSKDAEKRAKDIFGVGGAARVPIPTIYLSISRLYPLGERRETVTIKELKKNSKLYQNEADAKFREWYNSVIPGSIKRDASLSIVEKKTSSRSSLHMDMERTPTLSQSVGQDNIGNIISALVDIYLLSKQEDYAGAILCIDEVEVSLHPDTQIHLLTLLEKLADELNIQFVFSTHSLTILKELLKKQIRNPDDYTVVYLKNPSSPMVTKHNKYGILKADLLGKTTFDIPKTKMYFEDEVGQHVFHMLVASLRYQCKALKSGNGLRALDEVTDSDKLQAELERLERFSGILPDLQEIVMHLGCETLLTLSTQDRTYFQRVVFLLDGDARYKGSEKPHIREYLGKEYDSTGRNDRKHPINICFLPEHFAPESYLYRVIYQLVNNETDHSVFWRTLDDSEETALYTATKIRDMFSALPPEFNNDNLKTVFKQYQPDPENSGIWKFIDKSHILDYYYNDYRNVGKLINFFDDFEKAYDIAHAKTLENRFG